MKSVRTLANLSLATEIGKRLARDANVFDALLTVLNACASVDMPSVAARKIQRMDAAEEPKQRNSTAASVRLAQATREELLTNMVSARSNIS